MKLNLPEGLSLKEARNHSIEARRNLRALVRSKMSEAIKGITDPKLRTAIWCDQERRKAIWSEPELREAINECLVSQTHAAIAARNVQNI